MQGFGELPRWDINIHIYLQYLFILELYTDNSRFFVGIIISNI